MGKKLKKDGTPDKRANNKGVSDNLTPYTSKIPEYRSNKNVISTLEGTMGNVSAAAKLLGYAPQSLRNRINKDEDLQKALVDIREQNLDLAEQELRDHIFKYHNLKALLAYLQAIGKQRGYGSRSIEMVASGLVEHKHTQDQDMLDKLVKKFGKMVKSKKNIETIDVDVEEIE